MVDCSHANSEQGSRRGSRWCWENVMAQQRMRGQSSKSSAPCSRATSTWRAIADPSDLSGLKYGVSITDACMDWEMTEELLDRL